VEAYPAAHTSGWGKSGEHLKRWRSPLKIYAYPVIGALPVGAITTLHVLSGLMVRSPSPVSSGAVAAQTFRRQGGSMETYR